MPTVGATLARYFWLTNRERAIKGRNDDQRRKLREGEFMMRTFPGRYKNEKSAQQAYKAAVKERSSGKPLADAATPKRFALVRGKLVKEYNPSAGTWKVMVHYHDITEDGDTRDNLVGSFVAVSEEHTTLMAIPYMEELLVPVAEEKLQEWCDEYAGANCTLDYIEVVPISSYTKEALVFDGLP